MLLIEQDPTRMPDHLTSGPDLPLNDNVRSTPLRRMLIRIAANRVLLV
jgi:hypothetical protein